MKLLKFCLMISAISSGMFAMEDQFSCLRQFSKVDVDLITVQNPLSGNVEEQKEVARTFMEKLPKVITADTEGGFEVDAKGFRTLLSTTYRSLPGQKEVVRGVKRSPEITRKRVMLERSPSVELLIKTQDADPALTQLKEEVANLTRAISGKSTWVRLGAAGTGLFVAGMIVGWFYTTRAHYAAAHGAGQ